MDKNLFSSSNNKVISNEVCASVGCQRFSTTSIKFPIGFSANFCSQCAAELIRDGLGTNKKSKTERHQQEKLNGPDFHIVETESWSNDKRSEV
jgi:hypothetical protein